MDIVTIDDINYLAQQSSGKMNIILSGMTSLMNDTDKKVEMLESQDWFKRMVKTVTGKNKLTQLEIQQNHDKLNAYMSQAITELYNRNCIDHEVMMSLGVQLNEIYADHLQLKKMLGSFVTKLNEKIDSVDNFNMLITEINQGVYSQYPSIVAICKVISQLDKRILENDRKLDIIKRSLKEQEIINDDEILIKDYLMDIIDVSVDEVGQIYLELGTIRGNYMSNIILRMIEKYHFLPVMARKLKNKNSLIDELMIEENLDESIGLCVSDIYDDFINSKVEINNTLAQISDIEEEVSLDKAERIYSQGEFDEAFKLFKILAEEGCSRSQYMIGNCYYKGEGIEQNLEKALKWYMKGAENGYIEVQSYIGYCYENGYLIEKDLKEALKWYMKAAESGDGHAQLKIGNIYYDGEVVDKDLEEAFKWYIKGAENGNTESQFRIGECYQYGYGVEENIEEALKWYKQASENGDTNAMFNIGQIYHDVMCNIGTIYDLMCNIVPIYPDVKREKDLKEAFKWYMKAADSGHIKSQFCIGCYYEHYGVEKDLKEAFKWYMKAAENGYRDGILKIGDYYYNGKGIEKDLEEAFKWYMKASEKEDSDEIKVGDCCYKGEEREKELDDIFKDLFNEFNKDKFRGYAKLKLGDCYYKGEGVEKDLKEAFKWYTKAAKKGNSDAQFNIIYAEYRTLQKDFKSRIYFNFDKRDRMEGYINIEKIRNAVNKYANLGKDEQVIFCFDNTVFGSAKDGIVFTDKGIYHKFTGKWFISHADINEITLLKKGNLLINGTKECNISIVNKSERESFRLFLEKCVNYIQFMKNQIDN